MKIAVFSDVHANLEALEKFYNYVQINIKPDHFIFLGDAVGYGPNPSECIALIKKISTVSIMGNHDYAMLNEEQSSFFNAVARETALWTMKHITDDDILFLGSLPLVAVFDNRYFVHATPINPATWEYIFSVKEARKVFNTIYHNIIFIGHTHYPVYFVNEKDKNEVFSFEPNTDEKIFLKENTKYIFNVGSIGQPRDGDNRLSFVIHDTEENSVQYYRLEYDFKKTMNKIDKAELPQILATRLKQGK